MAPGQRAGNSNPNYVERLLQREMEDRITALEAIVKTLVAKIEEGVSAKAEITKLEDLKITELKVLCENNGIDYGDFGNTKAPYVKALKAKGL